MVSYLTCPPMYGDVQLILPACTTVKKEYQSIKKLMVAQKQQTVFGAGYDRKDDPPVGCTVHNGE